MVTSMSTAVARPSPIIFTSVSLVNVKPRNTSVMIAPAVVMRLAVRPTPRGTASRALYPVELEVRIGNRSLRTRPLLDDQELATSQPLPLKYWEGLVRVEGGFSGRGYLELTGYAGKPQL